MKILGVIPARYASTRFPAKPLIDIAGKSMIQRVYEQVQKAKLVDRIVVATDHNDIVAEVERFGGEAVMTSPDHPSGTDRCHEALTKMDEPFDYVLNIQGDEPFISPQQIDDMAAVLDGKVELGTMAIYIQREEDLFNPSEVKIVMNTNHEALYFSRQVIPYLHEVPQDQWFAKQKFIKHVGFYAYRSDILKKITEIPPSPLEKTESLEQLRWMEHGFNIKIVFTEEDTLGVDTPEDLQKAIELVQNQ